MLEKGLAEALAEIGDTNSVAVVGNGGSLRESRCGEEIELHSIVIRLNNFRYEGHEDDIGCRMDFWCTSFAKSINMGGARWKSEAVDTVLCPVPERLRRRSKQHCNPRMVRMCKSKTIFVPEAINAKLRELIRRPSTGLRLVHWLVAVGVKPSLYGFDCFATKRNHHYYSHRRPPTPHNPTREREVLDQVMGT